MLANMAAGARRINMGILFTNRKLPLIHSESEPRSRSKASTYSYAEKKVTLNSLYVLEVMLSTKTNSVNNKRGDTITNVSILI